MAMSVTVRNTSSFDLSGVWSPASFVYAKLTGDSSYPGGTGYAVTPGTFGLSTQILCVAPAVNVGAFASQGNYVWYDAPNKALRWIVGGNVTLSEVVSGSNIASTSLDVVVIGY